MGGGVAFYFVEGQYEEVIVRSLINDFQYLKPGRIKVLNITQKKFPRSLMTSLKPGTSVVFIFDTDAGNPALVKENIKAIQSSTYGVEIVVIPQCRNLEDELIYACGIREIKEITKSRSNSDFKTDLLHSRNVGQLLRNCGFDFSRLWNRTVAFEWESLRKGKPDRKAVSEKKR